jgi:ATP-dependent RNA helicase DeaD
MFDDHGDAAPAPRHEREFDAPRAAEAGMETFRIEVGHRHGVKPGNIVGAIANEAELESRYIGRIDIRDEYSLVDLPEGMPRELMEYLKKVRVAGQALRIQRAEAADTEGGQGRGQRPHVAPRGPRQPGGKPNAGPRKPDFKKSGKPRPPRS